MESYWLRPAVHRPGSLPAALVNGKRAGVYCNKCGREFGNPWGIVPTVTVTEKANG